MSYVTIKGIEQSLTQILNLKIQSILDHSVYLSSNFFEKIEGSSWSPFRSKDDLESSSHIISISSKGQNVSKMFNKLKKNKIILSMRNGRIRISLAHYNSLDDINILTNTLLGV